jgi:hypothetical protein
VTAGSARASTAAGTTAISTGDNFAAALGEEDRQLPGGVVAFAGNAQDRGIRVAHQAQSFKTLPAIEAYIFVNGHPVTSQSKCYVKLF